MIATYERVGKMERTNDGAAGLVFSSPTATAAASAGALRFLLFSFPPYCPLYSVHKRPQIIIQGLKKTRGSAN